MSTKLSLPAAMLAMSLWCGGCATSPAPERSLYERLGGRDAISAVITDSIGNIAADTRINQRFKDTNATNLTKNLVDLICERSGGPCVYTGRDMSAAHEGMQIGDDEFDALVEDLGKSMDTFKVPAREKRETIALLAKMKNAIVGH